jgi:RHS repeat-associated protein
MACVPALLPIAPRSNLRQPARLVGWCWVTWDNGTPADKIANRYDGLGNRFSQAIGTTSPTVTDFLLDLQPGLAQVIAATSGGNTTRYVHSLRGIHAQEDPSGNWTYPLHDGLGSARGEVTDALAVGAQHHYAPYGERSGGGIAGGFDPMPFGFTGEQTDANDLLYLRARHYAPGLGVFTALDPIEGKTCDPMTLNGYAYVGGSPINRVDASGMFWTSFAEQQQRRLNTYVSTQMQRLQRHINRATQWLGWVNSINSCGFGLSNPIDKLFRRNKKGVQQSNTFAKIGSSESGQSQ